ncbi:MAG: hypothetical protein ACRD32_06960, partial [Nitrososphaerales archaeon]
MEGGLVWRQRLQINAATVQTLTVDATGGTFTLTYKGQTTAAIAEAATAAAVDAALELLSTIGTGGVVVTGSAGGPYTITLSDSLGIHELITTDATLLTGGAGTAVITVPVDTTAGPTQAEFDAAFPSVRFINE